MNLNSILKITITASSFALVAMAHAFDFGADWSYAYTGQSVTFNLNVAGSVCSKTYGTAEFHGARRAGAQGGTATNISGRPTPVTTYCTELGQYLPTGYQTFDTVVNLLGATAAGVGTGPIVFDAARTDRLERLWGTFQPAINDSRTSAAFQFAQWELCFDNDATLRDTRGRMFVSTTPSTGSVAELAESMLSSVRNGTATRRQHLLLMRDGTRQDQITATPEPGTWAALGLGGLALFRRKRSK